MNKMTMALMLESFTDVECSIFPELTGYSGKEIQTEDPTVLKELENQLNHSKLDYLLFVHPAKDKNALFLSIENHFVFYQEIIKNGERFYADILWKTKKPISWYVYHYLKQIPKGKVVTYGQLAIELGNKHLSQVIGNVLHVNPDPIGQPCFKVVNAQGKLAEHFGDGIEKQRERLLQDGVEVVDDAVDLKRYQWIR